MPTKLNKPITATFENVENAVVAMIRFTTSIQLGSERERRVNDGVDSRSATNQIESALSAQGIDWRTWEPPQPIYIAGCEADFKSNGDVKLGSETLDRATLEKVYAESNKAMGKVEEWPKYFRRVNGGVARFTSETDGQWLSEPISETWQPMQVYLDSPEIYKLITRAEACTILGREI